MLCVAPSQPRPLSLHGTAGRGRAEPGDTAAGGGGRHFGGLNLYLLHATERCGVDVVYTKG